MPRYATSGERRHQVTLENPGNVPDGQGGYTEGLQPLTPPTEMAAIEPAMSGNAELPVAGTTQAALSHKVTLRWRPDVTQQTQITFLDYAGRTRRLWVRALQNPLERSEVLQCWCEEQVP